MFLSGREYEQERRKYLTFFQGLSGRALEEAKKKCTKYCEEQGAPVNGGFHVAISTLAAAHMLKLFQDVMSDVKADLKITQDCMEQLQVYFLEEIGVKDVQIEALRVEKDGQIEELQDRVKALEDKNAEKDDKINKLSEKIKKLQDLVEGLCKAERK